MINDMYIRMFLISVIIICNLLLILFRTTVAAVIGNRGSIDWNSISNKKQSTSKIYSIKSNEGQNSKATWYPTTVTKNIVNYITKKTATTHARAHSNINSINKKKKQQRHYHQQQQKQTVGPVTEELSIGTAITAKETTNSKNR